MTGGWWRDRNEESHEKEGSLKQTAMDRTHSHTERGNIDIESKEKRIGW